MKFEKKTIKKYLEASLNDNAADDSYCSTVAEYLQKLLVKLINEPEQFSSKRPFGTSNWHLDLVWPAVSLGIIEGKMEDIDPKYPDYPVFIEDYNEQQFSDLISQTLLFLFKDYLK